jgi:Short C-terminal domain
MGMRRRTRRRALVAGAAIAHHRSNAAAEQEQAGYDQGVADAQQAPAPEYQEAPVAAAPPAPDPYDQIEHLAQLHSSGALTDEEFAAEKAKVLAS